MANNINKLFMTHEQQVEHLIDKLGISIAEAEQLLIDDSIVDSTADYKEGNIGVLPKEKQQEVKKYRNTKKEATGKQTGRKANNDKLYLMQLLQNLFEKEGVKFEYENTERIIIFGYNENLYRFTLAQISKKEDKEKYKTLLV